MSEHDEKTPVRTERIERVERNGDLPRYEEERPFHKPSSPIEIAANCAFEAKAAALETSAMAGEMLGKAFLLESAHRDTEKALRELADKVSDLRTEMRARFDGLSSELAAIAKAVGVKRTYSGSVHLSLPPPAPPLEIKGRPTLTGEHTIVETSEIERIIRETREREAEERGAKDAVAKLQADEVLRESRAKTHREKLTLVFTAVSIAIAAAGFAFGHLVH